MLNISTGKFGLATILVMSLAGVGEDCTLNNDVADIAVPAPVIVSTTYNVHFDISG